MRRWFLPICFIAVIYAIGVLWAARATVSGQVTLLDAREQMTLAQKMSDGTLPTRPHYRAPLWAGFLSVFFNLGMNEDQILLAGQISNLAFHLLGALALFAAAKSLWHKNYGAMLAAFIYAVYPVALYFVPELLDTTLAQMLLCIGLWLLLKSRDKDNRLSSFLCGAVFAAASLTRPQLFCVLIAVLAINLLYRNIFIYRRFLALGALLVLISFAAIEYSRTGVFYFLPSQGSYNLWSANRPGTSGEYYSQTIDLSNLSEGANPARAEAAILYVKETGKVPVEKDIQEYWKNKFLNHTKTHPIQFTSLYLKKVYALFNNHEAYNNKTYSFQKELNPFLKLNPLSFVFISTLALVTLLFYRPLPQNLSAVFILLLFYVLGAALFYTSDRFRLPIVPLLLVIAAGFPSAILQLYAKWKQKKTSATDIILKFVAVSAFVVLFSLPLFGVGQKDTTMADKLLQIQASLKTGDDIEAEKLAVSLLNENNHPQSVISSILQARYNQLIKNAEKPSATWCQNQLTLAERLLTPSNNDLFIIGLCRWQLFGDRDSWKKILQSDNSSEKPLALAALMMTGELTDNEKQLLKEYRESAPIILSLAAINETTNSATALQNNSIDKKAVLVWKNLFERAIDRDNSKK
jgi:4-amino-4-deoxy-L-arabinose transferase-like glycosyltransferase